MDYRGPVVLVVDDEPAVRAALGAMLAHFEYVPLLAVGGVEALELLQLHHNRIAVVVLDVRMPGMDGPATFDALRELAPALPCVFLSGDTGGYAAGELLARGAAEVLDKPVGLHAFGAAIERAIGSVPTRGER
jgi:CheY-like chemotaxis protein